MGAKGAAHQFEITPALSRKLREALAEDVGAGDVTTLATVPSDAPGRAEIWAKAPGVLCGAAVAERVWKFADRRIQIDWLAAEGARVRPGDCVARLTGGLRGLLTGERVALNFLQQLSGVATLTRALVDAAGGTAGPLICDTRKTTPLWRALERHAVRTGGGCNHRFGLFDMFLIKENHARAAGGLKEAIAQAKAQAAKSRGKLRVAAEARDLDEVRVCCEGRVDLVMLDNFTPAAARRAIARFRATGIPFEISGGVTRRNIAAYAAAKPDRISIGALTHSAPALDLSLQIYQA